MKKTTKQVREALREKQPFAFTYRQLPMCVSPRICGAGICVGNRMFLAYTAALIRKVDTNLYQLPARYAAAVASLLNELWNTSAITEADFSGTLRPRRNPFSCNNDYYATVCFTYPDGTTVDLTETNETITFGVQF